jgi:hypothetical protein
MSVQVRRLLALQLTEQQLQCAIFHAGTLVRYEEISLDAPASALERSLTSLLEAGGKSPLVLATASPRGRVLRLEIGSPSTDPRPAGESPAPAPAFRTAACDARNGQMPSSEHPRLLLSAPPDSLDTANEQLKTAGLTPSRLPDATLAQLGALLHAPSPFGPDVLVWDLGAEHSHFIVLSADGVVAIEPCPLGLSHLHDAIQAEVGLRFRRAAAKLFARGAYDFSESAPRILARILPALKSAHARLAPSPVRLHITGLNRGQQWFTHAVAHALGLEPFAMDWPAFGQLNGLAFASLDLARSLPPSAGALLLLARQRHAPAAELVWQPRWSHEPEPPPPLLSAPVTVFAPATPSPARPRRRHPMLKVLGAFASKRPAWAARIPRSTNPRIGQA